MGFCFYFLSFYLILESYWLGFVFGVFTVHLLSQWSSNCEFSLESLKHEDRGCSVKHPGPSGQKLLKWKSRPKHPIGPHASDLSGLVWTGLEERGI